jgi:CheY-like chemotaxis protein
MLPILIVDDSRDDLLLAERVLRSHNILNPIVRLSTGEACIEYFRNDGNNKESASQPCLLLLDLSMKPISGLDVLSAIHSTPIARQSLIVMLSGITDLKMLREGYLHGARTFLVKPLNAETFVDFLTSARDKIQMDHIEGGYSLRWAHSAALKR